MKWYILKREVADSIYHLLNAMGQRIPFIGKLASLFNSWEERQKRKRSEIPISGDAWDCQYSAGLWSYMEQLEQLARYSVIVGYLQYLKPGGSVLDIGCGEGVLLKKLSPHGYSRYMGIDISEVAIDKASRKQDEKTFFIRAEAENHIPTESFDAIVFNETLYYFDDPLDVIGKYVHALREYGILIISTFAASKRAVSVLKQVKAAYFLLDEVKTIHEPKFWICSVFVPNIPLTASAVDLEKIRSGNSEQAVR